MKRKKRDNNKSACFPSSSRATLFRYKSIRPHLPWQPYYYDVDDDGGIGFHFREALTSPSVDLKKKNLKGFPNNDHVKENKNISLAVVKNANLINNRDF